MSKFHIRWVCEECNCITPEQHANIVLDQKIDHCVSSLEQILAGDIPDLQEMDTLAESILTLTQVVQELKKQVDELRAKK